MKTNNTKNLSESDDTEPLAELHRIREERAKDFNYDLKAMFEDLNEFEKKMKIETVSLPPKRNLKKTGS
jgi:hypothetical protein